MYEFDDTVMLPDTDAAGILFYGNYFAKAHEAYESFMETLQFGLPFILGESEILLLIAHAEADYRASLRLGDSFTTTVKVGAIGGRSFTLDYQISNSSGAVCATLKTVHVAVNKKTQKTVGLPEDLRAKLAQHL